MRGASATCRARPGRRRNQGRICARHPPPGSEDPATSPPLSALGSRLRLAACAAVVLAACSREAPPRPNLVLITLESLRTDHVGAYGGSSPARPELPITPHLDGFAAQ